MSLSTASSVHRQVAAVRRRLFLQTLVRALAWSWFAALALSAVWFLLEPLLLSAPPDWLRWTVLAVSVVAGTAAAVAFAVMRKPSSVDAALALDAHFHLKERVTTSLMLRPDEAASPAGAALLADADQRVKPLRVADGFPVRVPWTAALAPACAGVLALLVFFYHPDFGQAQGPKPKVAVSTDAMKADIDKAKQQLQAKREIEKRDQPKSADLKKIEADIDKMLSNPHETKDQVREDIKKGDDLLNQLRKQDQAKADQARALKERLEDMERARKKEEQQKREDGPAKDLAKAVDDGDLAGAKQEADDLAKKLQADHDADELKKKIDQEKDPEKKQELQDELKKKQDEGLSKEEREKLEQQLKDLKDQADELTKKNEEDQKQKDDDAKKLDDDAKKDGADKDQLQKEKDQLAKDKQQLQRQQQDLKDLGQKLGQAQQAMQQGKEGEAAQDLKDAGDKMAKLDNDGEKKAIAQDMQQVQQMKKALAQALAKQEAKEGDQAGNQPGNKPGNQGQPGNQPGQGPNPQAQQGLGSGARPEGPDSKTGEEEHQVHSDPKTDAPLQVVDKVNGPHDRFTGPRNPGDMQDEIRRAAQEGAAASERERLNDKGAADMSRQFFDKLRPPDKPDDKKPAPPK